MKNRISLFILVVLLFLPETAWAHLVNQNVGEFYAGMLHPLTAADHLIPVLVLGLIAGGQGIGAARRTVVILPVTLMAGTWLGSLFPVQADITQLINLAVIPLLGLCLIFPRLLPMKTIAAVSGVIGMVLGWRSGIDMAGTNVSLQFIPGVGLMGFILVTLISAWIASTESYLVKNALKIAGICVVAAGLFLILGLFWGDGPGTIRAIGLPNQENVMVMLNQDTLSPPVILLIFLAALGWGAFHALTPGHGKALVGAYLIGSRGTAMHALYLGLTVTATHTMGVLALGAGGLFASHYILSEQLMPWLSLISGLLIVIIGVAMLFRLLKGHHHHDHGDHSHTHHHHGHDHPHHKQHDHHQQSVAGGHSHLPTGAEGGSVSWRQILGLGISGGLLPCPAALVLLLTCISIDRIGLGILLVIAFSVGLAAILTGVGLLFIKGSRLLNGFASADRLQRYAPQVSTLVILTIGLIIVVTSVKDVLV